MRPKQNKSAAIRAYAAKHPDAGPTAIAAALAAKGVKVTPGHVASALRANGAKAKRTAEPSPFAAILGVKKLAAAHGLERVKAAVAAYEQLTA
jgi:hypothetical protein